MPVFQLADALIFPPPELAREDGLLAVGGDLSPERLLLAYHHGIFPWYSPGEPLLWWAPDPRLVLFPAELQISRRLARTVRQHRFRVSFDQDFPAVIEACAGPRRTEVQGTWIDWKMREAYTRLHQLGFAHSVECWREDTLAGGLYGVSLGGVFFGESMFSRERDSSKVALVHLVELLNQWEFDLIDCQLPTLHLKSLGAREISGADFSERLQRSLGKETRRGSWAEKKSKVESRK
jgi:leucyl/phenylalanyl-tRNA--protein transferase